MDVCGLPRTLVSATGSTPHGKAVGAAVGAGWDEPLLELGATMPLSFRGRLTLTSLSSVFVWSRGHGRSALYDYPQVDHSSGRVRADQTKAGESHGQLKIGDPLNEKYTMWGR